MGKGAEQTATQASASNLKHLRTVHRDLLEHALEMRCVSYLADAKAKLLIRTVTTIGESSRQSAALADTLRQTLAKARREAEARQRLQRRLEQVTEVLDHAHVMFAIGSGQAVSYANQAFRAQFGADFEGVSMAQLLDRLRAGDTPQLDVPFAGEVELCTSTGSTIWVRLSVDRGALRGRW